MKEAFKDWTKEELIGFLSGTIESHNKLKVWLYKNHKKIWRQYEDEELNGMRLELLNSQRLSSTDNNYFSKDKINWRDMVCCDNCGKIKNEHIGNNKEFCPDKDFKYKFSSSIKTSTEESK